MASLTTTTMQSYAFLPKAAAKASAPVSGPALLLSECSQGEKILVVRLHGHSDVQGRLEAVGVYPGQVLTVFRAGGRGAMVVDSTDMRLALDRRLADLIVVRRSSVSDVSSAS